MVWKGGKRGSGGEDRKEKQGMALQSFSLNLWTWEHMQSSRRAAKPWGRWFRFYLTPCCSRQYLPVGREVGQRMQP